MGAGLTPRTRKRRIEYAGAAFPVMKKRLVALCRLCHSPFMRTAIDHRGGVGGVHMTVRLFAWAVTGLGLVLRAAAAVEAGIGDRTFKLREVSAL